jgi:hypothetical protein
MKARTVPAQAGILFVLVQAFLFWSCENVYLQELLRGNAALDNLTINADNNTVYSPKPAFRPQTLDPVIRVPYATSEITVIASFSHDEKVTYTMGDETNETGVFPFLAEDADQVLVRVERKYMNPQTYTLTVRRGSDSTLWDLFAWSVETEGTTAGQTAAGSFDPGFDSDVYEYVLTIGTENPQNLRFESMLRPNAEVHYELVTDATGSEYASGLYDPAPETGSSENDLALLANFAAGDSAANANPKVFEDVDIDKETYVYLRVRMKDDPDYTTEMYKIRVLWPRKVSFDDSTLPAGSPWGSSVYENSQFKPASGREYYPTGNPVSFYLYPPFGTTTSRVVYVTDDDVEHMIAGDLDHPLSENDLYSFIMPFNTKVRIRAAYRPVAAPAGINVKFAYPNGKGAKDGSRWYDAAGDLQKLIDEFDPAPGAANNYDIWLAGGLEGAEVRFSPDWSATYSAAPVPGWYTGAAWAVDRLDHYQWSFVLKNGVRIYGGFKGTESAATGRVYTDSSKTSLKYKTVFSENQQTYNKLYHTVIASGSDHTQTAYLDGLVITGSTNSYWGGTGAAINGNSISVPCGGALYVVGFSPVLKNVTINGGLASSAAGMGVAGDSRPVLIHCSLTDNQSAGGGSAIGIWQAAAPPLYTHLLMIGGKMYINLDAGGVLYIMGGNQATLVNVSINNNKEAAVNIAPGGTGTFINCTISGNRWGGPNPTTLQEIINGGKFYNSVVQENYRDGVLKSPAAEALFNSRINNTLENPGTNAENYPLAQDGSWNSACPEAALFSDLMSELPNQGINVVSLVEQALLLDGNGNKRNGIITLGAAQ